MAITSTESFLALLEKSQLLSAKDLEKVQAAAGKYADAKALAKALINAKGLTRWQAGQLLAGRSSFTLGKYRLVDLLGRGGMGSVFAAEHKKLGRRVALKIISKQTGRDPEKLERFLNEARRIAALDHPNIVRAFDVDHEGERYFLVLERVNGSDLQQIVESGGPLDIDRAARYTRQAALGLAHAHERKMIHCDIKPANIIVGDKDVAKILDMGMARLVESDGSSSDSNEDIVGTIDYVAPEQAMEAKDLDHRVDIYSLGCTLYFLLSSRPPFGEGTLAQRIMKHQTQAPRPISETRSGVPEELAEICMKMMAKKPEDRYQTAAEVAKALEPWAGGEAPTEATKEAAPVVAKKIPAKDEKEAPQEAVITPAKAKDVSPAAEGEGAVVQFIRDEEEEEAEKDAELEPKDEGAISISVADSGSFSTRGGKSRGKRPTPVKSAPKSAPVKEVELEEDGEPLLIEPAGFFDDPRKKWATIIGAGLLLLAGGGGVLAWMLGGGDGKSNAADEKAVASAEPAPTEPIAPASESGLGDLDGDLDLDLDSTFGGTDKPPAEEKAPAAEEQAAPADDSEKAPEPADAMAAPESAAEGTTEKKDEKTAEDKEPPKEEPKKEQPKKEEAKKEEPKKEEPKKEAPKPPPKVVPFKDFPTVTNLPDLSGNDPVGEASKAPITLGAVRGPADVKWQLLLTGGADVLKGGREFGLEQTDMDTAKASWDVVLMGDADGGKKKLARIWRQNENLRFQWDDAADAAVANYFRNCFLQVRVPGDSRYLALTEPVQAEPIQLDLLRGQSNASVALKWAPDTDMLRFKFTKVQGIEKVVFDPAEPVAPRTKVAMNFVYTDRHQNDTNAVIFEILPTARKTSLRLDVRLVNPQARVYKATVGSYDENQIGVMIDQLGNQRDGIQRSLRDLKGEKAVKKNMELDAMNLQIWYLEFFNKAQKKAALEYQVVADIGGRELVLVSTN